MKMDELKGFQLGAAAGMSLRDIVSEVKMIYNF